MKKSFLINVDTEAHRGNNPVDDLIYGRIDGEEYGINKIMDICEKYNVHVTFFVDFAEINTWGYNKIMNVCNDIILRGHDIQLHLHPEHFGNWDRQEFSQYTYEEQKKMIEYGVKQYERILGYKPIAFRAGKYSANKDTIKVLNEMGIEIDSSFVKNNHWCKLNRNRSKVNAISDFEGVYEIPVTVFKERIFNREPFDKYYIFDVNGMTRFEFKDLYNKFKRSDLETITLFMHSFSFLKRYKDDMNLKPNQKDLEFFEYILKYVTDRNDFTVVTYRDYYNNYYNNMITGEIKDYTPMIDSFIKSLIGIFCRYKKASIRSKQFRKYILGIYVILALFVTFIGISIYKILF